LQGPVQPWYRCLCGNPCAGSGPGAWASTSTPAQFACLLLDSVAFVPWGEWLCALVVFALALVRFGCAARCAPALLGFVLSWARVANACSSLWGHVWARACQDTGLDRREFHAVVRLRLRGHLDLHLDELAHTRTLHSLPSETEVLPARACCREKSRAQPGWCLLGLDRGALKAGSTRECPN
jgi:hypothetical protein